MVARPLKLSIVSTFYLIMCLTTYQRLTQIQSFGFYIPEHLRKEVIEKYHDNNGHMGIDKTHDAIKTKYYWPNMYKNLYQYVTSCVTCQTRNLRKVKPPQQETDAPPYPFAKLGLDVSGPYPKTLSGNKCIIGFVDWYSGWPEAFTVPDKTAETVVHYY